MFKKIFDLLGHATNYVFASILSSVIFLFICGIPLIAIQADGWIILACILLFPLIYKIMPLISTVLTIAIWIWGLIRIVTGKAVFIGVWQTVFPIIYYILFVLFIWYMIGATLRKK